MNHRLYEALSEVVDPDRLDEWLATPNDALDDFTVDLVVNHERKPGAQRKIGFVLAEVVDDDWAWRTPHVASRHLQCCINVADSCLTGFDL